MRRGGGEEEVEEDKKPSRQAEKPGKQRESGVRRKIWGPVLDPKLLCDLGHLFVWSSVLLSVK